MLGYSLALFAESDGMDFTKKRIIYFVTKMMKIIKKI